MKAIFQETKNCWKLLPAERVAIIIDGEEYYRALHEAMRKAEHRIMLVGWDLHSELALIRNEETGGYPACLGEFLDTLVEEKEELEIYLLCWDFAMIYAMEREFFPRYKLQWRTHQNIHFCLDGEHPLGASQHQKMVVIDDTIAFAGGFDVSKWRWDTRAHKVDDERRTSPDGDVYPPFHDVQMLVDGEAARAIATLAFERWEIACGKQLTLLGGASSDPWPESISPLFEKIDIAVARTLPQYGIYSEIREVEALYLDSIQAAAKSIYIENQYLSSFTIGEALARRLEEEKGPDIVIVMPLKTGGWLEQHSMDVLRGRVLKRLIEADQWNRLRVFYPRLAKKPLTGLMVHAKVMVIDESFIRVGSSNLSNRSLGLDSECDLALHVKDDPELKEKVRAFRHGLLAEHLGVEPHDVARKIEETQSLVKAIDALRSDEDRTLVPIDPEATKDNDPWVPQSQLLDPERPLEPDELLDYFIDKPHQKRVYKHSFKILGLLAVVLGLAALWHWTPLRQWLDVASVLQMAQWAKAQPFSPLIVLLAFIAGGFISFPVTLMIIATIVIFGPWLGTFYTLVGCLLSALCVFQVGRWLGRDVVKRLSGTVVNRINKKISNSGIPAVITFRIVPVAPFSLINLVAGVSEISTKDFIIGTLIGLLPGTLAIVVVGDQIARSMQSPDLTNVTVLSLAVVGAGLALAGLRKWLASRQKVTGA
nr:VTT domain-containing protein [uncultured Desulfobulbus sp.]